MSIVDKIRELHGNNMVIDRDVVRHDIFIFDRQMSITYIADHRKMLNPLTLIRFRKRTIALILKEMKRVGAVNKSLRMPEYPNIAGCRIPAKYKPSIEW